jgi:hypothetical protein
MKLLHTEYLKNVPPELMEELKLLEARQAEYVKMHADLKCVFDRLQQSAMILAEQLQPYCHCPRCRPTKTVKSDAQRGADIQNAVTLALVILCAGFVFGYWCGLGR